MFTRRMYLFPLVILFLSTLLPSRARAGDEWLPIDPAELKMTSEPLALGAPAIYLYRQVDRNDKLTASSEYNYLRIKILTEEGRKYANIEIPFEKEYFKVSGIRARTIHPDGTIVNFDGKVYENTIEKAKGLKILAKTFSMPEATVGSIVEYSFNYDFGDYTLNNSQWILSEELFTRRAKFSLKPYAREGWRVVWVSPAGLPKDTVPAKEDRRSCHPDGGKQHPGISSRRLYAAGKRAEIQGDVYLPRRCAGDESGQILGELREKTKW